MARYHKFRYTYKENVAISTISTIPTKELNILRYEDVVITIKQDASKWLLSINPTYKTRDLEITFIGSTNFKNV